VGFRILRVAVLARRFVVVLLAFRGGAGAAVDGLRWRRASG